uniref:PH_14 domain-containing protein n=1 Tax=Macrostomum lignano TaxID=282301 RepID=A0A1I8FLU0_9PLAT
TNFQFTGLPKGNEPRRAPTAHTADPALSRAGLRGLCRRKALRFQTGACRCGSSLDEGAVFRSVRYEYNGSLEQGCEVKVDEFGFFIYWKSENGEGQVLELSQVSDVRTGSKPKLPIPAASYPIPAPIPAGHTSSRMQ